MKTSETLEKGFVESRLSQTENPCGKLIQGANPVVLCNLSESFTSQVNYGYGESGNGELPREVGYRGVEECRMCGGVNGNDQIKKGSFDINVEDTALVLNDGYKVETSDVPTSDGSDGICVEKTSEEKGDDVLHSHEPDSPTKIEVSGNGINVFVEVFGPLDGMYESDNDVNDSAVHVLGEIECDPGVAREDNANMSFDVKSDTAEIEDGDFVGEQEECMFCVGDLVWTKTRSQLWWPGMISDPSYPAKDADKSERKGCFLVKYYGSANFIWCSISDMKPFLEYFEQMSGQINSNNFIGSVEKALFEFGQRVKSKMTCPCFSKESQLLATKWPPETKKEDPLPMDNERKYDALSLSQFVPARFVSSIKNLAQSGNVPGKIELAIMKNCLSTFYSSVGHLQLPLQLLRPSSETVQNTQIGSTSEVTEKGHNVISEGSIKLVKGRNDDLIMSRRQKRKSVAVDRDHKIMSSGKGSESRERKKSKYLSYPYVDVDQGPNAASTLEKEPKNLKEGSNVPEKSTSVGNCSGSKSRIKRSKKPLKGQNSVSRADDIDACPAELLSELRSTALDCFYLNRSNYSGSLKRFYCSFRKFSFLDAEIASKHTGNQPEPNGGKCLLKNLDKVGVQMKGGSSKKKNPKVNLAASGNNSVSEKFPEGDSYQAKENVVRKRRAKKKKEEVKSGLDSKIDSFSTGTNITPSKSNVISFQKSHSEMPKSITNPENRDKGANPGPPQIDVISKTDLNNNHPNFSVENAPVEGSSTHQGRTLPEKSKGFVFQNINTNEQMMSFASLQSPTNVQVTVPNISQLNHGTGANGSFQFCNAEVVSKESMDLLGMRPYALAGKLERKKRKRKEKTAQVASVIPDLSGGVIDAKALLEENLMSPEDKPQAKKMSESFNDTESGLNAEKDRVPKVVQDPGGSILLNFAPGFTLPSRETLVATFSRFGLLKESDIQIPDDSSRVEIVYKRSSDARFAFRSLERTNPFGESLATFNLTGVPDLPLKVTKKRKNLQILRQQCVPANAGESLDVATMRRNVDMMKVALEKAGSNVSPEERAKLENQIKSFLALLGTVGGSSSS